MTPTVEMWTRCYNILSLPSVNILQMISSSSELNFVYKSTLNAEQDSAPVSYQQCNVIVFVYNFLID